MSLTSEKTNYEHVALDDKGVPIIVGTNMKVVEIVLEKTAYGWSPEELHFQHPYLTLGQIYSAHGRGTMQSVTNSKFQTTIHKAVRKILSFRLAIH